MASLWIHHHCFNLEKLVGDQFVRWERSIPMAKDGIGFEFEFTYGKIGLSILVLCFSNVSQFIRFSLFSWQYLWGKSCVSMGWMLWLRGAAMEGSRPILASSTNLHVLCALYPSFFSCFNMCTPSVWWNATRVKAVFSFKFWSANMFSHLGRDGIKSNW